jgi:hypothetical protein
LRAVPYSGLGVFARIAARTTLARAVLSVVLVALVLAAAAAARHPHLSEPQFVPPHAGGIVVLDLSASVSTDTYSRIGQTLRQIVRRGGRYGLVVFSNTAYEALPPGTPASALKPLERYFTLQPAIRGEQPTFPTNPWTKSFTSGTKISAGLGLALELLDSGKIKHPAVVLVSDLADDNSDVATLQTVLTVYKIRKIPFTVVSLNALPNDQAVFSVALGKDVSLLQGALPSAHPTAQGSATTAFPRRLLVLTVLVAALLAASELRSARLRWGHPAVGDPAEVTA